MAGVCQRSLGHTSGIRYFSSRVFPEIRNQPRWAPGTIQRLVGRNGRLMDILTFQGRNLRRALQHVRPRAGDPSRTPAPEDFLPALPQAAPEEIRPHRLRAVHVIVCGVLKILRLLRTPLTRSSILLRRALWVRLVVFRPIGLR